MTFFSEIKEFDSHIKKSIPNYELLHNAVVGMSDYFKSESYPIYDLGCSTGNLLKAIDHPHKIGIDNQMGIGLNADLNKPFVFDKSCIIISLFTMQFLEKSARKPLIKSIYESLIEGGAFIFAEKVYSEEGMIQDIFTFPYYEFKSKNFSSSEILSKEKEIRGIMKPNTTKQNLAYLEDFSSVSMFYKFFNFECYLCVK